MLMAYVNNTYLCPLFMLIYLAWRRVSEIETPCYGLLKLPHIFVLWAYRLWMLTRGEHHSHTTVYDQRNTKYCGTMLSTRARLYRNGDIKFCKKPCVNISFNIVSTHKQQ